MTHEQADKLLAILRNMDEQIDKMQKNMKQDFADIRKEIEKKEGK